MNIPHELVKKVSFARMPSDELTSYEAAKGVLVEWGGGQVVAVATDGHRIAWAGQPATGEGQMLVDASAGQEVKHFPPWRACLPNWEKAKDKRNFTVARDGLKRVLRLARPMADKWYRGVRFSLAPGGLTVSSTCDAGEFTETLSLRVTGEPLEVGFNADYLLDFLHAAASGPIHCQFENYDRVAEFTALGETDCEFHYLLMPMRL